MRTKQAVVLALSLLIGLSAGAAAATAFYWNRATALPTWYSTSGTDTAVANVSTSGNLLESKLASGQGVRYGDNNRVEISLTEAELTQLLAEGIAQTPEVAQFFPEADSLNATIRGDRVAGGIVVNPADLPTQGLPPQAQQALETALSTVPMLGDRPLYIGIEGSPRVDNGRLVLGNDTRVQIGRVNLSLDDVARLTGLDPAQITERINLALPQAGLTLDGLEFVNGEAVLRGATQN
ncbi:hypothetical protein [Phormidium tenue]|uniref:DUF2993 domain-containing protein n=1 Tax=Phormidium tenue NIES-30 TaxID=549789 RepID=A0A1U7J2L1_9CYAN|nr:hypothetical protein [Phormidium tenue]MBD2231764.1 hypothetical protein [Phormidium tenue FACHB-1052]OKH46336.1 hypothetical protein NIES30_16645 [Phormidium tenue NIES-30]